MVVPQDPACDFRGKVCASSRWSALPLKLVTGFELEETDLERASDSKADQLPPGKPETRRGGAFAQASRCRATTARSCIIYAPGVMLSNLETLMKKRPDR